MAIDMLTKPTTPNPVSGDWEKLIAILDKAYSNIGRPIRYTDSVIPKGSVFKIVDDIFYANDNTTITGTKSDYIKLTVNVVDHTAEPSYVTDLTGVSWNSTYNNYYDVSNNLYLFDEQKAIDDGLISIFKTKHALQIKDTRIRQLFTAQELKQHTIDNVKTVISAPRSGLLDVTYDPINDNLISAYSDDVIVIHNGITGNILSSFSVAVNSAYSIAVNPVTGDLITGVNDVSAPGHVHIRNGISAAIKQTLSFTPGIVYSVAVDNSGNLIALVYPNISICAGMTSAIASSFSPIVEAITFDQANLFNICVNRLTTNIMSVGGVYDRTELDANWTEILTEYKNNTSTIASIMNLSNVKSEELLGITSLSDGKLVVATNRDTIEIMYNGLVV